MKLIIVAFAALTSAAQIAPAIRPGTITTGDVALATAGIPRYTADRYPALPPSVREELTAINCQIPGLGFGVREVRVRLQVGLGVRFSCVAEDTSNAATSAVPH